MASSSLLPSSLVILALRAVLFFLSRRFLTNTLSSISLAGVGSSDGAEDADDSGVTSPLIPLSRKASGSAISLLGLGSSAAPATGSSSSPTSPELQRDPFVRQSSDGNLHSLGTAARENGGASGGGSRWDRLRGSRRKSSGFSAGEKGLKSSNASQIIFPLLFSESLTLYLLVLFQALSLLTPSARQIHWQLSLWILVGLLVVVVPAVQGWVLMRGTKKRGYTTRIGLAAVPFFAMQVMFYLLPIPAQMLHSSSSSSRLDPALARLGVIGVLVLGALSGVGSINTALTFYSRGASSSWEEVTSDDIVSAERSLRTIRRDILDRELEKNRRTSAAGDRSNSDGRGWFGKMVGAFKGSEDTTLEQELRGLRLMRDEVSRNLRGMMMRKERMRFSKTLKGRIWNFAGYLFAVYCILRLLLTLPSLLSPTSSFSAPNSPSEPEQPAVDWLSYLLALALSHLPFEVDVPLWSRLISLGLAGLIVASSVEYVLGWVRRVLGKVGGGRRGVRELGVMILGQLMALYLLSLLIQLRNSLPPSTPSSSGPPSSPLDPSLTAESQLLATLPPFKAFNRLFDLAYVFGAVVMALTAWVGKCVGGEGGVADGSVEIWREDD